LSTLIKLAISLAHAKFSDQKSYEKNIRYYVAASSRDILKLDNYKMGNFATILYIDTKPVNSEDNFWDLAKAESDEIHAKIDANSSANSLEEDKRFLNEIEKGFYFDEYEKEFCLSNLGDMKKYSKTEYNLFNINEHYVVMSNKKLSIYNIFFNGIATINDRLFWTICYPCYLIKREAVEFMIEKIQQTIDETIS
jgi:hypothetical protein